MHKNVFHPFQCHSSGSLDKKKADTNELWHTIVPLNLSDKDRSGEHFKSEEVMIADLTKEVVNREAMKRFAEDTSSSYEAFPHFTLSEGTDTFGDTVRKHLSSAA